MTPISEWQCGELLDDLRDGVKEESMSDQHIMLCSPVRTAIGAFNGALKGVPATVLGAAVVKEVVQRAGVEAARVASVVMGNVLQAGNGMNSARQASIGGGLPVSVPALTV